MSKKQPPHMAFALTPEMAQALMDAHEIEQLLTNEEEFDLLAANNQELLNAYVALRAIAHCE